MTLRSAIAKSGGQSARSVLGRRIAQQLAAQLDARHGLHVAPLVLAELAFNQVQEVGVREVLLPGVIAEAQHVSRRTVPSRHRLALVRKEAVAGRVLRQWPFI